MRYFWCDECIMWMVFCVIEKFGEVLCGVG